MNEVVSTELIIKILIGLSAKIMTVFVCNCMKSDHWIRGDNSSLEMFALFFSQEMPKFVDTNGQQIWNY